MLWERSSNVESDHPMLRAIVQILCQSCANLVPIICQSCANFVPIFNGSGCCGKASKTAGDNSSGCWEQRFWLLGKRPNWLETTVLSGVQTGWGQGLWLLGSIQKGWRQRFWFLWESIQNGWRERFWFWGKHPNWLETTVFSGIQTGWGKRPWLLGKHPKRLETTVLVLVGKHPKRLETTVLVLGKAGDNGSGSCGKACKTAGDIACCLLLVAWVSIPTGWRQWFYLASKQAGDNSLGSWESIQKGWRQRFWFLWESIQNG
jgi:hypothetical protein